jgi:hypothetical protein
MYEQIPKTYHAVPNGYPYKAPTSLFSAFRWIAEELLNTAESQTMSIFATTHYSSWKTILDENLYSREKPNIERVIA